MSCIMVTLLFFIASCSLFFIFYCNIFTPASFMRTPCLIIEFTFEAAIPHTLNFSLIEKILKTITENLYKVYTSKVTEERKE